MNKSILKELEERSVAVCLECGDIFECKGKNLCPNGHRWLSTRWVTSPASWIDAVHLGLFTNEQVQ